MDKILLEGTIFVVDALRFDKGLLQNFPDVQKKDKIIYLESILVDGERREEMVRNFSGKGTLSCYLDYGISNGNIVRESKVWEYSGQIYLRSEENLILLYQTPDGKNVIPCNHYIYCLQAIPSVNGQGMITIISG